MVDVGETKLTRGEGSRRRVMGFGVNEVWA